MPRTACHEPAAANREMEHLRADALFAPGAVPVHVNRPRHDGDVPLHDHDFLEIAVVLAGRALHRTVHGDEPLSAGDVIVLRPGQWHAYVAAHALELGNCCLGSAVLADELAWTASDPRLCVLTAPGGQGVLRLRLDAAARARVRTLLDAVRAEADAAGAGGRARQIGRAGQILGELAPALPAAARGDDAVGELVHAMARNPEHDWGLVAIARTLRCERATAVRRFRRVAGLPPMAWLTRRRAERAAVWLLTSALPVAEIGTRVGWRDPNHFARRFRGVFGVNPRAYRARGAGTLPAKADWVQW